MDDGRIGSGGTGDLRGRILELENAAEHALLAYLAIGMGPNGWTERDRDAFSELDRVLAAPAQLRSRIARLEDAIAKASTEGRGPDAAATLEGLASLVPTDAQLEQRRGDLMRVSSDALEAYRSIGMGPRGWNGRDRAAFAELAAVLEEPEATPPPAAPAAAVG